MDFFIITLFFPETKGDHHRSLDVAPLDSDTRLFSSGKTLEQMAEIFGDEVDAHDVLESAATRSKLDHDNLKLDEKSA